MDPLVVRRRPVAVSLATLPAVGIAALAQVLKQAPRGLPLLVTAVLLVACGWAVGRLFASRVGLDDAGIHVRGMVADLHVGLDAVLAVTVAPAPAWVRRLLWGLLEPYAVTVHLVDGRSLSPVALWASHDDREVERLVTAIRTRLTGPSVPRQRQPAETDARVSST